jgi:hypothetical protein
MLQGFERIWKIFMSNRRRKRAVKAKLITLTTQNMTEVLKKPGAE